MLSYRAELLHYLTYSDRVITIYLNYFTHEMSVITNASSIGTTVL